MVDEAWKGADISARYPGFYRSLLQNADLREAFREALEALEVEAHGAMIPLPGAPESRLDFLFDQPLRPIVEIFDKNRWRTRWQRTIEQLQTIFSPPELAYRFDPSLSEDPWFTLLRGETEAGNTTYTVMLECTLSEKNEGVFSAFLNVAVTLGAVSEQPQFPIRATLEWGQYDETLSIHGEGRMRFPDIPLAMACDDDLQRVASALSLTLEAAA